MSVVVREQFRYDQSYQVGEQEKWSNLRKTVYKPLPFWARFKSHIHTPRNKYNADDDSK